MVKAILIVFVIWFIGYFIGIRRGIRYTLEKVEKELKIGDAWKDVFKN